MSPLSPGTAYRLEVSWSSARRFELDATLRFRLPHHDPETYRRYVDGELTRAFFSGWNSSQTTRTVDWYYPSADGVVDRAVHPNPRTEYVYRDGENVEVWVRTEPGADGDFGTSDDRILYRRRLGWTTSGLEKVHHQFAGDDHLLDTEDDYDQSIQRVLYGTEDRRLGSCSQDSGPDKTAFSPDDEVVSCTFDHSLETQTRTLTSTATGPDGAWGTEDDEYAPKWTRVILDEMGRPERRELYSLSHTNQPEPSLERMSAYTSFKYEPSGLAIESIVYGAFGSDGQWLSDDDLVVRRATLSYDTAGWLIYSIREDAGPDKAWGTRDDALEEYTYPRKRVDVSPRYPRDQVAAQ